ncbi:hypothetical protein BC939DRAFT_511519 [Gamsiella multidivaricata]|uniref:uncharacterized protein n=1 Tax=Gamsiella multidivaricata TaxID=101098 RepID=UPI00221F9AE1|nr:uncharacterized protein BC939DRAFT_511519 [Gamsiella multidivaricata]KAI7816260.1 hypothetical protein BC939DRAFT_511519 [Gamsiella multidivaricata]
MIKVQRNECTFYNCVQGMLDREAAIQSQECRIDQGFLVRDGDRPVPLTKSGKNYLIRLHSTAPVQVKNILLNVFVQFERREDRSMDFICVCRKPFLTRDSLSKHCKWVCAHSNIPINIPGLQLIDSAQVLPDDLEIVNTPGTSDDEVDEENDKGDEAFSGSNALIFNNNDISATSMTFDSGRVIGATIQEFMRGLGIANTQQQHAQRMQIMAHQEQQRTLITAMEQRILSSIAQTAAGQG